MASKPLIVNSYQGAFGPPTRGHYEAMLFSAKQTLLDYPDSQILMLFMPTASSSSKPHLALTQKERLDTLQEFCKMLKAEIGEERINFEPSSIEYKIYEEKKSCMTIHTLDTLKTTYPDAKICLTMGVDNLLDLPFWQDIAKYPTICDRIYILDRDISAEIKQNKLCKSNKTFQDNDNVYFNKTASWNFGKQNGKKLMIDNNCDDISLPINVKLKELNDFKAFTFIKLKFKPSPTSSSLLRIALIKYYGDKNKNYYEAVKTLEGREPVDGDPWYQTFVKTRDLETQEKIESFNNDYYDAFNPRNNFNFYRGGKRRSKKVRRSRRKSRKSKN